MPHAGKRACRNGGGQCAREDKPRRVASKKIDERSRRGDISANESERFGKSSLYDCHAVGKPIPFGDSAAMRAVEPDCMDFVEIGHSTVSLCDIAQLCKWRYVAVHRVDGFKANELWS